MKYEKPVVKIIDVKEDIIVTSGGSEATGCTSPAYKFGDKFGDSCNTSTMKQFGHLG